MKPILKYGLSALAVASVSVASAADDKPRFESSGFLQSLDAFISQQISRQSESAKTSSAEKLKGLDLSLSESKLKKETGFLALSDSRPILKNTSSDLTERPDFTSLLAPNGGVRGTYTQDLFGASSRVGLSFGGKKTGEQTSRGFEIALESQYRLSLQGLSATSGFADAGQAETHYRAGVSFGYSGFGIDASLMRQSGLFAKNMEGFEAGFSYRANSWSARIAMTEYTEGTDLYGIENEARNIISYELGGNYRLSDKVGLTGGVRYYDYGNNYFSTSKNGDRSQMIFLGGRLRF